MNQSNKIRSQETSELLKILDFECNSYAQFFWCFTLIKIFNELGIPYKFFMRIIQHYEKILNYIKQILWIISNNLLSSRRLVRV